MKPKGILYEFEQIVPETNLGLKQVCDVAMVRWLADLYAANLANRKENAALANFRPLVSHTDTPVARILQMYTVRKMTYDEGLSNQQL